MESRKMILMNLFAGQEYQSFLARTWKQPRCPLTDEWIKNLWYIHTMEYYSAIQMNTFESVLMRQMNLEPVIQSEVSQKEQNKYYTLTHIHGMQKDVTNKCILNFCIQLPRKDFKCTQCIIPVSRATAEVCDFCEQKPSG